MSTAYYVPSGRLPARVVGLTFIVALAMVVPAWLYAWLTMHSPLILLDWCAMLAFALAMGLAAARVARVGKARHPLWMGRLGLALGLAGWYAQWAAWLAIAEADGFMALLGDPRGMLRCAMALADARRVAGMRIEGSALVAAWLIELIVLTSVARALARATAEEPFCEQTNTWATDVELPRKFAWIDAPDIVVHRLESQPRQLLSILAPCLESSPTRYSVVTLHRCSADPFMSIDNVRVDRKKQSRHAVLAYLRLPGLDADRLLVAVTSLDAVPA